MKNTTTVWKVGVNRDPIDIDFDCCQMDALLVRENISKAPYTIDRRPYLVAMAFRQSRTVFCFAITIEAPSIRNPIKELVFLKPIFLQGLNLIIHAERGLFSQDLVDRHFSKASFVPKHPASLQNIFLERTLSKVIHATSGHPYYDAPNMNAFHHAERPATTTLSNLTSRSRGLIGALNTANRRTAWMRHRSEDA
ncbi:hypothetical protein [Pseudomonas chlororaphis]|uniref:hypothetical protein n=1 Tax=Pseudomonas chlororaphis TaxID=587753 RepID=UPI002365BC82|nr:hypothetical protein [Pseudomonas chlororaphis]WDH21376.1 hypothetical protein PUP50_25800 [Pseudomonas chlororaphis]